MTLVRRVAVRVAAFTVRHASVGSREWAEGLAREVEAIPEDWKALRWAFGSMRVLLERHAVRAGADHDLKPKPPSAIDVMGWILYFELALNSAVDVVKAGTPWDRTGACLCAFAWIAWFGISVADWHRSERWEPSVLSDGYLPFQKRELERSLTRFGTVRRRLSGLAIGCWIAGRIMQIEGGMHLHHVSSAVWIVLGILGAANYSGRSRETIQRRIVEMDERIAKAEIEKAERIARGGRDKPAHSDQWGRAEEVALESAPEIIQLRLR